MARLSLLHGNGRAQQPRVREPVCILAQKHAVSIAALRVYVLAAFQKKSKKGSATPQADIGVQRQRLARAAALNAAQE